MFTPLYCRLVDAFFGMASGALRRGRTPGLNPGHASGLKLGDDLVGDFVVEVRPVLAGARASSMV